MSVSLKGFHEKYVTMAAGESCTPGSPVEVTADNTASDCADGGFAGVWAAREGDLALVQVTGHMTIPAADGLALGTRMVEMAGGKLAAAATGGRPAIVTALAEATAEIVLL